MCLHVLLACMYVLLMPGTHREQIASGSQGLALQLWDIIWVLGIDVRASARATSTLTHGVNSPASKFILDTLAWSPPIQARLAVQWAPEIYLSLSPTLELQGTVSRFLSGCVYLPSLLSVVLKHSLSKTDKYQPRWTWEEGTLVEDLSLSDQTEGKSVVHLIGEGSAHCVPLTLLTV